MSQYTEARGYLRRDNPQGPTGTWVQAKVVNSGANDAVYNGRCRHVLWGVEQAAEADGMWGWATSRWTAFRAIK